MVHIDYSDLHLQANLIDAKRGLLMNLVDTNSVDVEEGDHRNQPPGFMSKLLYSGSKEISLNKSLYPHVEDYFLSSIRLALLWKPRSPASSDEKPEFMEMTASLSCDHFPSENYDPVEIDLASAQDCCGFLDFLLSLQLQEEAEQQQQVGAFHLSYTLVCRKTNNHARFMLASLY